jgi:hypothetical protein
MNIYQRLAKVMEEVTYIQKEKKQGMRYSIVSHDAVTAKVRPVLLKHGVVYHPTQLAISQNGNRTEVTLTVRFVNVDEPSDCIDVPSAGYGIDDQDKGPGKAISYAVKYSLLKALGMESGDDPDEDQVSEHVPAVAKSLELAISMAETADQLEREVAPQIKQHSAALSSATLQLLRTKYAQKQRLLQPMGAAE